jgi:hypothetical protein|eukprot:7386649-Prymnesium_polylepis.1
MFSVNSELKKLFSLVHDVGTVQAAVATGALVPSPGVPSPGVRLGMRRADVLSVLMRASRLARVIIT